MFFQVWADYESTGIQVIPPGMRLTQRDIPIPDDLWCRLQEWVKEYDPIVPMSCLDRFKNLETIRELDKRGLELTESIQEIMKYLKPDIPVTYYSEGLMREMDKFEQFDVIAKEFKNKFCKTKGTIFLNVVRRVLNILK